MSATGMQTSVKYAGPEPRTQSKAVSATLNCIRWGTGSQWRTSRRTGVTWSNLPVPTTRQAVAFSTIYRRRVTCVDAPYRTAYNSQPESQRRLQPEYVKRSSVDCQGPPYILKLPELVEEATDNVPDMLVHRQFTVNNVGEHCHC